MASVIDGRLTGSPGAMEWDMEVTQALRDLVEVVEVAIDSGLMLSIDGKKPEVMALERAKAALYLADAKSEMQRRGITFRNFTTFDVLAIRRSQSLGLSAHEAGAARAMQSIRNT